MWHLAGAIVASNEEGVLHDYFDGDGNKLSSFAGGDGFYVGYCNNGVCYGASQEYTYQSQYPYFPVFRRYY
jgi:hypothetical protein